MREGQRADLPGVLDKTESFTVGQHVLGLDAQRHADADRKVAILARVRLPVFNQQRVPCRLACNLQVVAC